LEFRSFTFSVPSSPQHPPPSRGNKTLLLSQPANTQPSQKTKPKQKKPQKKKKKHRNEAMQKQNTKKMLTSFPCTSKTTKKKKKKKETMECKLVARNRSRNLAQGEDDKRGNCPEAQ
jgi:hypothetical protein